MRNLVSSTWFYHTKKRTYHNKYAESPPARIYILRWVQNFDEHGCVGNAQASGRPGTSSGQAKIVSHYLRRYVSRALLRVEKYLPIPRSLMIYSEADFTCFR